MDLITINKIIERIKTATACSATALCKIGCVLEYLLDTLKKNGEADKNLEKELQDLIKTVNDTIADLGDLTKRVSTVEYRLDVEVPDKFHQQLLLIEANKEQIGKNTIDIHKNLNQINLLWDSIRSSGGDIGNIGNEFTKIYDKIRALEDRITNINTQISNISTQVSNLGSTLNGLVIKVTSLESSTTTSLANFGARIDTLNNSFITLSDDLNKKMNDLKDLVNTLTGGSADLLVEFKALKEQMTTLQSTFDILNRPLVTDASISFENGVGINFGTINPFTKETSVLLVNLPVAEANNRGLMSPEMVVKLNEIAKRAEVNVQSDWSETNTTLDSFIKNKPVLATVATSGAYSDLSGRPALATVATSGSYNDLSNKPTIPAAYVLPKATGSVLGGVKIGTGLAITNDGVLSATGGGTADSVAWANVTGKPQFATVATSGSYNDLSNKPAIPEAYTLPAATASALGGIKLGYTASGKNYPVKLDSSNNAYVNVPWEAGASVSLPPIKVVTAFPADVSSDVDGTIYINTNASENDITKAQIVAKLNEAGEVTMSQHWVFSQGAGLESV